MEQEQNGDLGDRRDEKVKHGRRERDLGVENILWSVYIVGPVEVTGGSGPRRRYCAC